MNTRKKSVLNKTLAKSFALFVVATCFGTAAADPAEPRYTMAVIEDAAQGGKVLAGNYDEAIGKIRTKSRRSIHRFYSANNLCVAFVMARDLENAATACDAAVSTMQTVLEESAKVARRSANALAYRKYMAIALSNRGVFRAVMGENDLALDDFRSAMELEVKIPTPAINMARLSKDASPIA